MRKRVISLASSMALVLALFPTGKTQAVGTEYWYTVTYSCIYGPPPADTLMGEWYDGRECGRGTDGWGWEPGTACTTTWTVSNPCSPE